MESRRILLCVLGGICCVVLVTGIAIVALSARFEAGHGFDASRWRQAQEEGCTPDNPRLGMYRELRSMLLTQQPVEADVLAMLGPPDAGRRPGMVGYTLGYNIIDCDTVEIHFGPDGRVSRVRYVQG